jgi:hypothetical protein
VTVQPAERCPVCASAVRPGAQWCTLCFADLRPREPEPASTSQPSDIVSGLLAAFDPLTAPLALLERDGHDHAEVGAPAGVVGEGSEGAGALVRDASVRDGAVEDASVQAALAGWPCLTCGAIVQLELSACTACGAGFMTAGPGHRASGGRGLMSAATDKKAQLRIMIGGAGLICVMILVVLFVIGALF